MKARWVVVLFVAGVAGAGAVGYWLGTDSNSDADAAPQATQSTAPSTAASTNTEPPLVLTDAQRAWCLRFENQKVVVEVGATLGFWVAEISPFRYNDILRSIKGDDESILGGSLPTDAIRACTAAYELR